MKKPSEPIVVQNARTALLVADLKDELAKALSTRTWFLREIQAGLFRSAEGQRVRAHRTIRDWELTQ